MRPSAGARFLLERTGAPANEARAVYRATIFTPDGEHGASVTLVDDGAVEVGETGAPAELHEALVMLARLTARGAAKRRDDGLATWPARILRWRGPGRGG
jgi:hypothetical protein